MNIHKSQLFWCELQGYYWFWHCHMIELEYFSMIVNDKDMFNWDILWSFIVLFPYARICQLGHLMLEASLTMPDLNPCEKVNLWNGIARRSQGGASEVDGMQRLKDTCCICVWLEDVIYIRIYTYNIYNHIYIYIIDYSMIIVWSYIVWWWLYCNIDIWKISILTYTYLYQNLP